MELTRETQVVQRPSNQRDLIAALKAKAEANPAFNAVCHIFAMRERARQQVTIKSLMLTMQKEGFTFAQADYEAVIIFLASVGLGKLDYNAAGKLRGLKEIKVTLQSIGMAAISKTEQLKSGQFAHTFKKLPIPVKINGTKNIPLPKQPAPAPAPAPTKAKSEKAMIPRRFPLTMVLNVEGQPFSLSVPGGATMDEVGTFMQQLIDKRGAL